MDSKKLEILMTAVNLGSFSKASEVVGYTQSGLTHLINGLEREIGMTLIRRDHSGIALTEDGEALLPAIREYLSATARLENQIEAITKKRTATIRIAAYASVAMHWMPEILYRFRRVCPDTDVDLRMVDHELEPFELLEAGRTDVIFAARQSRVNCDWTPLYYDAMYALDYDMCVYSDSGNYDYNNIRQQVDSESVGMYVVCYKDDKNTFDWQKIENLVDQGVLATDTKERYDIYTELWSMIMDTKTILPLYHGAVGIAWSDRVKIDSINPFYYHLTDISWAK